MCNMACVFNIEGEDLEYDLSLEYDENTDEYVALYLIDGEVRNVGRDESINKAVTRLAEQMNGDIGTALMEAR